MFDEFNLSNDNVPVETKPNEPMSAEEQQRLTALMGRLLKPEEHRRLELLLLERIKHRNPDLEKMFQTMSDHWGYEDSFYRFYHASFKVYAVQNSTDRAVKLLRELLPERELNLDFAQIIHEGTGKNFEMEHNREWLRHTRPMLEAFTHARFMIEMAVRYADLPKPPQPMPSGYAALLYLFDLR
jgi:hypothetical protein